ncbi:MAG: ABC transporter ATP-binding protein [Lachnospiraceae bacterium]|nr:ABC transporter ATP-binding protein [Lachnospiraceae bacterium]
MSENNDSKMFESLSALHGRVKDGTFQEIIDDWKWIFSYSKRYKGAIFFYTVFGILSSTLGLASSVASKYVIDIITGYKTEMLGVLIAVTIGTAMGSLALKSLLSRLSAKISIKIHQEIQADIFDHILDSEWLKLTGYSSGDILNRFSTDVRTVASNAVSWLPSILIAVYSFIATFAVIWHYNKIMSLMAFITAPVMLVMSKFLIRKQREYTRRAKETASSMMTFEVETFYNIDTIKSFGIMDHFGKGLREWQEKFKKVSLEANMFSILTNIFMSILGMIAQYAAFGYCLYLLWTRQITYGTMVLFLEQRGALSNAFNSVISIVPSFLNSSVSAHRIRELNDLPKEAHLSEVMDPTAAESGVTIEVKDVDYAYEEGRPVLEDASLKASPGEIIAMIGPSGEGKTTMVRLLLGLVHPDDGTIDLSYGDTLQHPGADIRCLFSYVPQGNTILSGTIAENLRMVKDDATDEELQKALETACAWDFVSKMKDGINTPVREKGRGLSEGQAQRIAIARAILRDAPVLLLDEATSALDVATERRVLKNLMEKRPNRTCIVTTHRPSVLHLCERVYLIEKKHVRQLSQEESARMAIDF